MNKIILCCIFAVFLSTAAPAWSLEGGDDQATVDHLVEMALNNNPDLVAAHERWQMFERKVVPAKTLSDPKLSFAFSNYPVDSLSPDDTPMTGNDLRLDQAFPFPGKLKSRGDAARQQAL